jgi:hypothetical protein
MREMVATVIAALALTHAAAPTYTIRLDRLLAPTVNGHALTSVGNATRSFGAPSSRSGCTAYWSRLTLELNTCGIGTELTATAPTWRTASGLHPGDTAARAHALYPQGRSLNFLDRGTLWQLETGGAMCDGGPTLALAAKLAGGRVVALEVVRVPACG